MKERVTGTHTHTHITKQIEKKREREKGLCCLVVFTTEHIHTTGHVDLFLLLNFFLFLSGFLGFLARSNTAYSTASGRTADGSLDQGLANIARQEAGEEDGPVSIDFVARVGDEGVEVIGSDLNLSNERKRMRE